ncbi:hypothetical protein [Nocardia sp. CC201C]|uniref:hypothetical protein n=1 Tax=Nocardia sp. CC201C TaxID=3044575 RepID=UPI0024A8609E|nr:hypothetical protein [Nocardia sp. CC201C]
MAFPPIIVPAPTLTPARAGLRAAADQVTDAANLNRGIAWEPPPCGPAHLDPATCADPPTNRVLDDGLGALDRAEPIHTYAGFVCRAVGLTEQEMLDRAATALASGEWTAVESAVWSSTHLRLMRDVAVPADDDPANTAVLSATPVSLVHGIALAEAFLAANYGGVGVLHAPRLVAAHAAAAQQISIETGRLVTALGNRWAFGAGYPNTGPDGAAAAAGTAWLVVTGAVFYRRGPVVHRPARMTQAFDANTNEIRSVAERVYVVSWDDCVRAAVPVTLT